METCPHHETIATDVKETKDIVLKIYKRLFEDNGTESFQTFRVNTKHWIDSHDKNIEHKVSFWYWVIPIGVSVILVILDKIVK